MRAAGYPVGRYFGESLGMVAFVNFIEPAEVVKILFRDMFKAELDPDRTEQRNLLSAEFIDVGVSLQAGVFEINEVIWNVYIVTCDFASDQTEIEIENQLFRWLNEFRVDPEAVAARLDREGDGNLQAGLIQSISPAALRSGFNPLARNRFLDQSALMHNRDMIENYYLDHIDTSGKNEFERIQATGYPQLQSAGEEIGALISPKSTGPDAIAQQFMRQLIMKLNRMTGGQSADLIDGDYNDVGIAISRVVDDDLGDNYLYVMTINYANSVIERAFLIGSLYTDRNKNDRFDFGEGVEAIDISLVPIQQQTAVINPGESVRSGLGGVYQLPIESFVFYNLVVRGGDGGKLMSKVLAGDSQNQLLDINIAND
jgi:hypothetical protein